MHYLYIFSIFDTISMKNTSKINKLLHSQPYGTVFSSIWLKRNGYSYALQQRYRESGWLESIGNGATKRIGDQISVEGGIYTLQDQLGLSVHIGGKSAIARLGRSHYLQMGISELQLFGIQNEQLPKWFSEFDWGVKIDYRATGFLPRDMGTEDFPKGNFTIKISGLARALLECLYASDGHDLVQCYELLESMNGLRPKLVQALLENCSSVKVKRLFLFMAEKAGHSWLKYINLEAIDLGSGTRSLVKQGTYVQKYNITLPKELIDYGENI